MKQTTFTVVIPLYNKAAHIADTLKSVLAQSYQHYEIVVVDDGSRDDGASIVEALAREHSVIRLIRQDNAGVSVARNTGITHANNDYIAFLDGDDLWLPNYLDEIARLIQTFPEAGGYSTAFAHFTPDGRIDPIEPAFPRKYDGQAAFIYDYFEAASGGELPMMTSAACIPKVILDEVGGFPAGEKIGEDQDVWIRVGLRYSMAYSRTVCMHYLVEAENRASVMFVPEEECPFSIRLKMVADRGEDPRRKLMLKLTGNHLLHLAQLNILAGKKDVARRLLNDPRTLYFPLRRLKWELKMLFS